MGRALGRHLCLAMAMLLCVASFGKSARLGRFTVTDRGEVEVDGFRLRLCHFSDTWARSVAEQAMGDGKLTQEDGRIGFTGVFSAVNGAFDVRMTVSAVDAESVRVECAVSSRGAAVGTNSLSLAVDSGRLALYGCQTEQGRHLLPEVFDGTKAWQGTFPGPVTLTTALPGGMLTVRAANPCSWQDERQFGGKAEHLRFGFDTRSGQIEKTSVSLTLQYRPFRVTPLDLRSVCNVGFRDEVAGDGKGGWTDQGPENDLKNPPRAGAHTIESVRMEVIDPARNGGRSCIGLKSPNTPLYPASVEVPAAGLQGRWLYLVHCVAWEKRQEKAGWIVAKYADGTEEAIEVVMRRDVANWWEPADMANCLPVFLSVNDSASVGLVFSRFKLNSKPLKGIEFRSADISCWMIVSASLCDDDIPAAASRPLVVRPGKEWRLFEREKVMADGGLLDFSHLLDAPAGKYGFVRRNGRSYEFERRPGVPVRFWGGNTCFSTNFMGKADVDRLVSEVAALGYNIVRFHHYDRDVSRYRSPREIELRPEAIDQMDYLVAQLKARGIYLTLDFFTIRDVPAGAVDELPEGSRSSSPEYKALTYLSETAFADWQRFVAALMNHVNPYTGLAWKDEPAFVQVCLVNEGNIIPAMSSLRPPARALFDRKFEEMARARGWQVTPETRTSYYSQFLVETHRSGYRRMVEWLRRLGVRMLCTDQNMQSAPVLALMRQDYDVVDNHYYFQHPSFLERAWQLPVGVQHVNVAGKFGGSLAAMFPTRLPDRPFSITEWDFCPPSRYATEGGLAMGAYSALQDWGMVTRFALSHNSDKVTTRTTSLRYFDILNDPQRLLSERMGALAFLRGDVTPAKGAFVIEVTDDQAGNTKYPQGFPEVIRRLGLVGLVASVVGQNQPLPAGTRAVLGFLPQTTRTDLGSIPYYCVEGVGVQELLARMQAAGVLRPGEVDTESGRFVSETGEVTLDHVRNTFQVVTPRSEGFSLPANAEGRGAFMRVTANSTYSCFMAASRDGQPLAISRRILLLHLTESLNALIRFRDANMTVLENWGTNRAMYRAGKAQVTLSVGDGPRPTLYACSQTGQRLAEVPCDVRDGKLTFTADNTLQGQPVFVYELVR